MVLLKYKQTYRSIDLVSTADVSKFCFLGMLLSSCIPERLLGIADYTSELFGFLVKLTLERVAEGTPQGHKCLRHGHTAVLSSTSDSSSKLAWAGAV